MTSGSTPREFEYDRESEIVDLGDGRWSTEISDAWNIGLNPNGGYLSAGVVRALQAVTERPDPLSITTHYLRPGLSGESGEISASIVRMGRRTASATATLTQGGKQRLQVLAAFGDLDDPDLDAPDLELAPPPVGLPAVEECRTRQGLEQGVDLPIMSRLDVRIDPKWAEPGQGGRAEVSGWIRFGDGRPTDAASLVLFADAFPPSLFSLVGRVGWVPTLELTVHVRRRPAPGWIRARFVTEDLRNGLLVENGQLWDETGALVAQGRQLALLLEGVSA